MPSLPPSNLFSTQKPEKNFLEHELDPQLMNLPWLWLPLGSSPQPLQTCRISFFSSTYHDFQCPVFLLILCCPFPLSPAALHQVTLRYPSGISLETSTSGSFPHFPSLVQHRLLCIHRTLTLFLFWAQSWTTFPRLPCRWWGHVTEF